MRLNLNVDTRKLSFLAFASFAIEHATEKGRETKVVLGNVLRSSPFVNAAAFVFAIEGRRWWEFLKQRTDV